jgi:hypothetical protein
MKKLTLVVSTLFALQASTISHAGSGDYLPNLNDYLPAWAPNINNVLSELYEGSVEGATSKVTHKILDATFDAFKPGTIKTTTKEVSKVKDKEVSKVKDKEVSKVKDDENLLQIKEIIEATDNRLDVALLTATKITTAVLIFTKGDISTEALNKEFDKPRSELAARCFGRYGGYFFPTVLKVFLGYLVTVPENTDDNTSYRHRAAKFIDDSLTNFE